MLPCKAQIQEVIWRFREEGPVCHAAGCYQEGNYVHKPARRAPAWFSSWPQLHSPGGRAAEKQEGGGREETRSFSLTV